MSIACLIAATGTAEWRVQPSGTTAQFRGISVVDEKVAWLAGSMGTYGRMVDGSNWFCAQIPGAEKLMFRSVVGFDSNHAVLLAIGPGEQSKIFATSDGGLSWTIRWSNEDPKAFYDSIAFWDRGHGIAFSDPVDKRIPLVVTQDGGLTWQRLRSVSMPAALKDEGAFSASGTCIAVSGKSDVWIATGGAAVSRVFHSRDRALNWTVCETPIPGGKPTAGVFGLRFSGNKRGIAVGGDYKVPKTGGRQIAITDNGGLSWRFVSKVFPVGLREAASYVGSQIVVVGPSGSDSSADGGKSWTALSGTPDGLHTCDFFGPFGWAAGDSGLIAKWVRTDH